MNEKKKLRIPSMVWIFIAFVPWIFYWVLAGMGYTAAAILSGLAVSLAINGYRFAIRKMKILDMVTLAFLAVAAFVTFALGSDLLVFYGGVLTDIALALMAWGSLIAGNPFTYDYAKENWDKAFWKDPIFIETNQIITAVWGGVFTTQALIGGSAMVLGLEGTARIILVAVIPRSLLATGIAFSAWFPQWYPQRAAARLSGQRFSGIPEGVFGLRVVEFMPLVFSPEAACDLSGQALRATVQFHLSGDGGGTGWLEIDSGRCTFHPGEAAQPTLVIESPAEVWTAVARGEMSGSEAYLTKAYTATGDLEMLLRLDAMFGGGDR